MKCEPCDGVGYVCDVCQQPDGQCTCLSQSGPDIVTCIECGGSGEVPDGGT